jgi:hypothetical protein
MQLKLVPHNNWQIAEQRINDPVSGLTFEFARNDKGEPRLRISGPGVSRTIDFAVDGCVHIFNADAERPLAFEEPDKKG